MTREELEARLAECEGFTRKYPVPDKNTEALIQKNLQYDKETGKLFWARSTGRGVKGQEAGSQRKDRYIDVSIANKKMLAHRVVWFLSYGTWPQNEIDHIDGDGSNNKIENLRDVTLRKNQCNRKVHRLGRLVGCYFHKTSIKRPWEARIRLGGKRYFLGSFQTEEEAYMAYMKKYQEQEATR